MANWQVVFPYAEDTQQLLLRQGYPCPNVSPGNRLPTTAEIKQTMHSAIAGDPNIAVEYPNDDGQAYTVGPHKSGFCVSNFDWQDENATPSEGYFSTRCDVAWCVALLHPLSQQCGQLVWWPDSGATAIIFQPGDDPHFVRELWEEADKRPIDHWHYFFQRMYGEGEPSEEMV